ncbi:hypothetical protein [Marinomonas sp. A3A]|nr:hypothetical protein [Marinomonas sp. A3A]
MLIDVEQGKHQERGQTIVSSGGVWFARVYNGGQGQSSEEPK